MDWEVQCGYKKKRFHCGAVQPQRGCVVSILEGFQTNWIKPRGSPFDVRADLALSSGLGLIFLQRLLPTSNILWSYVCVGVCKYGLSKEWVLMEYAFIEWYRGCKCSSVLVSYIYVHLTRNTLISMEKRGGGRKQRKSTVSPFLYLPNTLQILF